MEKRIFVYKNDTEMSQSIEKTLRKKLLKSDLKVYDEYDSENTDLIICIGGDGTLLRLVQEYNFPKTPIVGINTGHLGFFQEIFPGFQPGVGDSILTDDLIALLVNGCDPRGNARQVFCIRHIAVIG